MFCLAFIEIGNASEAYRRAYAASRMAAKTVHECASRVLADRKVSARVAELRAEAAERAKISATEVIASLAREIRFDPKRLSDEKGRRKKLHEMDEDTLLAVRVEADSDGKLKYKSPDKTGVDPLSWTPQSLESEGVQECPKQDSRTRLSSAKRSSISFDPAAA
jgi:hypothetical protein